jgi:2-polyprenyl-3-methyl-5-hydroxy-6-metoxy-1,4-benzoquinol methylase
MDTPMKEKPAITDYRARCYNQYISASWKYYHSSRLDKYALSARLQYKKYLDLLPADKQASILDAPCGTGHFLYYLQQEGYTNIKGIDISAEALAIAQKAGVKNLEQADIFKYLAEHERSFDFIAANDIIEHLHKAEIMTFLDLLYKALKPGGRLLIHTANTQTPLGGLLLHVDFTHETGFTPVSLAQVLRVAGFKDVAVKGEKPNVRDLRSGLRAILWWLITKILKGYVVAAYGSGRGVNSHSFIFEPHIYAVATRH